MKGNDVGGMKWMRGKPYYRAKLSTGERPAVALTVDPTNGHDAERRAAIIVDVLQRLRHAGRIEYEKHWLRKIARASTPTEVDGYVIAVEAICAGTTLNKPKLTGALELREFGQMWTSDELARLVP